MGKRIKTPQNTCDTVDFISTALVIEVAGESEKRAFPLIPGIAEKSRTKPALGVWSFPWPALRVFLSL